jgi:Cu+-exporting ATPase
MASPAESTQDPVCGMSIDREKSMASGQKEAYRGQTYYFCSDKCHKQFVQDPAKYVDTRLRSAADIKTGPAHD